MLVCHFDTRMMHLLPTQGKIAVKLIQDIALRFGSIKELLPIVNHGGTQKEIQHIYLLMTP